MAQYDIEFIFKTSFDKANRSSLNSYRGLGFQEGLRILKRIKNDFDLTELDPEKFRRNVLVEGIDLNTLIGKQFTLQGIEFEGVEECRPCYWMDEAVHPGVHEALKGHGGLRAKILTSGTLRVD